MSSRMCRGNKISLTLFGASSPDYHPCSLISSIMAPVMTIPMFSHVLRPLLITVRQRVNTPHIFEWLIERKGTRRRHGYGLELIKSQVEVHNLDVVVEYHPDIAIHGVYSLSIGCVDTDVFQHAIIVEICNCTWENTKEKFLHKIDSLCEYQSEKAICMSTKSKHAM